MPDTITLRPTAAGAPALDGPAPPAAPGDAPVPPAPLPPLLVRAPAAARLCGVSRATWHRLAAAGRTPTPLRLGGAVLWRVAELAAWTAAGCPDRRAWEALRQAQCERRS
jgi:predicted DNA-binding transcriptional regulator AlpA